MDAQTILRIKPALTQDLHEFDGCMGRVTNRRHTALVRPPPRRRSPRAFCRWANAARPPRSSRLGDPAAPPVSTESSVTTSALAMFVFQRNEHHRSRVPLLDKKINDDSQKTLAMFAALQSMRVTS